MKPVKTVKKQNITANNRSSKSANPKTGTINGHEWVDLGLSVKWATMNVGASSPSGYGGRYAWGETSTKACYEWNNCFDCLDDTGQNEESWEIYKKGGKTEISPSSGHDTARENWGGTWRMPTAAEVEELRGECQWKWTSKNGHNGYLVTGPNGNSLFLPAAGYRKGTHNLWEEQSGLYWSNAHDLEYGSLACTLEFSSIRHETSANSRKEGLSVCPVTD